MFNLSKSKTFRWPVTVEFPADNGRIEKQTFDVEFYRLPQSRLGEIYNAVEAKAMTDREFAVEILAGWHDVLDGEDVLEFNDRNRDRLLDVVGVQAAIIRTYGEALRGAKRKN